MLHTHYCDQEKWTKLVNLSNSNYRCLFSQKYSQLKATYDHSFYFY